jgi:C_GCAxxG_C_C family probable redox protein
MSKSSEAAELLTGSNLNCAQVVLSVFSEELGLDKGNALKVALAFGGGMGRTGGMCGAVTGACMVLGLREYPEIQTPAARKEKVYSLVQEFSRRFIALHTSTNCSTLLGYDLSTPEGLAAARANKASSTICPKLVADAVTILEEMG